MSQCNVCLSPGWRNKQGRDAGRPAKITTSCPATLSSSNFALRLQHCLFFFSFSFALQFPDFLGHWNIGVATEKKKPLFCNALDPLYGWNVIFIEMGTNWIVWARTLPTRLQMRLTESPTQGRPTNQASAG